MSLREAVEKNDVALVKQLIGGGYSVNGFHGRWSPLLCAATKGFVECVRILLEAGAHLTTSDDIGRTPLIAAFWNGHVECARVCLFFFFSTIGPLSIILAPRGFQSQYSR